MLVGGPTSRLYLDVGIVKYVSENYITLIIRMHPCSEQTLSACQWILGTTLLVHQYRSFIIARVYNRNREAAMR